MRQYKSKKIETIIYGITGMVFAAAFFFGIMYPEYGVSQGIVRMEESRMEDAPDIIDLDKAGCRYELRELKRLRDQKQLTYTSYFYECLKKE